MSPDPAGQPARPRLSRNVIALGFVSLLTDASTEIIYPLLPLFLSTLGAGAAFIGLVEGLAESTASLLKLVSGWFSDRLGKRKAVVIAGYGLSSLTRPLIALAFQPWHVLVVRFMDRIGKGFRGAPRDALVADSTDPAIRGRAFGFHRAMDNAGAVVGPLIAVVLLQWVFWAPGDVTAETYRKVFWVACIPAALAMLTLFFFVSEKAPAGAARRGPLRLTLAPFDANFKRYLLVLVFFTIGNSSDAFLLLRAKELGIPGSWIPVLWVALNVVKTVSSVPGSAWSDRVGRGVTIRLGWIIYALIYAGFAFATSGWHVWVLFALYGIYFGLTEGAEKALIADLVPASLRGTAYGLYGFAIGVAALPSSLLMGWLWESFSPMVAFLWGAGFALAAAAMLSIVRMPRPAGAEGSTKS